MTDLEIIQLIRENKLEKPIKELYVHFPYVKSTLLKYGALEVNIQEFFNDSLVLLIEKSQLPNFELKAKLSTYLVGISLNLHRNHVRKENRSMITFMSAEIEAVELIDELELDQERETKLKVLDKVLDSISEKCKQILRLFYFERKSMNEIAEAQGYSSVQSAKTQKYKCLETAHVQAMKLFVELETTVQ